MSLSRRSASTATRDLDDQYDDTDDDDDFQRLPRDLRTGNSDTFYDDFDDVRGGDTTPLTKKPPLPLHPVRRNTRRRRKTHLKPPNYPNMRNSQRIQEYKRGGISKQTSDALSPSGTFISDAGSPNEPYNDPYVRLNSTEVELVRHYYIGNYPFKWMIVLDIMSLFLYASVAIVSIFAAIDAFEINNSIFFISGMVINLSISIGGQMSRAFVYWAKREKYGFTHQQLKWVTYPVFFGVPMMIIAWFVLGRWYWANVDECCGKDDSQPIGDRSFTTYSASLAFLACSCLMAARLSFKSIYAHANAEMRLSPVDHFVHETELRKDVGFDNDDDTDDNDDNDDNNIDISTY